ncbi:MAG TPA: hypothetical protein DHM90_01155 [Clostridiaceae bacterium]|nr:hypothetical protein [Clostridiaceae bacterium]
MNMKMNLDIKTKKITVLILLLLSGIAMYFYLSSFFQSGVDYYGSFMREETGTSGPALYAGKTEYGETQIALTTMRETDRFIEIEIDGQSREYVMESSTDGQKIRLFDSDNSLIFSGTLDRKTGIISTSTSEDISYYAYQPVNSDEYGVMNPDPILIVMLANRLNERYRGNLSMLVFSALILLSLIIDMIFPKFFFRLKNLKFKDDVELPSMYRKMQKYSWMISPLLIIVFLYMAL